MSKLKLQATDGNGGTVSLKGPASTTGNAEFELTLPGNAGSNGQVLSTNGSGVLTWSNGANVGGATGVDFNDNVKARWGTGNDLEIYHDGTQSLIEGTAPLYIKGSNVVLYKGGTTEKMFEGNGDGASKLYYDGSKQLETTSTGAKVTGKLEVTGAIGMAATKYMYGSSGLDFYGDSGDAASKLVQLVDGGFKIKDSNKIQFGDSQDLQIYHDGHSRVKTSSSAAGNLVIDSNNDINLRVNDSEMAVHCKENTSVELYYDNTLRFQTTAGGVLASGALESTGLIYSNNNDIKTGGDTGKLMVGAGNDLEIFHNGTETWVKNITGNYRICNSNGNGNEVKIGAREDQDGIIVKPLGATEIYHNGAKKFETLSDGIRATHIHTSSAGSYGWLKDDSSYGMIIEQTASKDITIRTDGSEVAIREKTTGYGMLKCFKDGAVELFYDGGASNSGKKLETTSIGATLTGRLLVNNDTHGQYPVEVKNSNGNFIAGIYESSSADGRHGMFYLNENGGTNHVKLSTNGSSYLTGGSLLVGTTTNSINSSAFGIEAATHGGFYTSRNVDGGSGSMQNFGNAGEHRVMGDGDVYNTNNTYGQISDERLKQDIVDAASQWDDIQQVKVRKFRFKDNPTAPLQIGVVAQELEAISPGLVKEQFQNGEDGDKVKSVKYSVLYMKAIKALQEAMARIETLETQVAALGG